MLYNMRVEYADGVVYTMIGLNGHEVAYRLLQRMTDNLANNNVSSWTITPVAVLS